MLTFVYVSKWCVCVWGGGREEKEECICMWKSEEKGECKGSRWLVSTMLVFEYRYSMLCLFLLKRHSHVSCSVVGVTNSHSRIINATRLM